jgi:hypothetical protein
VIAELTHPEDLKVGPDLSNSPRSRITGKTSQYLTPDRMVKGILHFRVEGRR